MRKSLATADHRPPDSQSSLYCNYGHMLARLAVLSFARYLVPHGPQLRIVPLIALIPLGGFLFNGYKVRRPWACSEPHLTGRFPPPCKAFRGEVSTRLRGGLKRRFTRNVYGKMGFDASKPFDNDDGSF